MSKIHSIEELFAALHEARHCMTCRKASVDKFVRSTVLARKVPDLPYERRSRTFLEAVRERKNYLSPELHKRVEQTVITICRHSATILYVEFAIRAAFLTRSTL